MSAEHSIVAEDLFLSGAGMIFHFRLPFLTSSSIIFFSNFPHFQWIFLYIYRLISSPPSFLFFSSNEIFLSTIQRVTIYFSISRRYCSYEREENGERKICLAFAASIIDASSRSRIRKTDTNRIKRISPKQASDSSTIFPIDRDEPL